MIKAEIKKNFAAIEIINKRITIVRVKEFGQWYYWKSPIVKTTRIGIKLAEIIVRG